MIIKDLIHFSMPHGLWFMAAYVNKTANGRKKKKDMYVFGIPRNYQ